MSTDGGNTAPAAALFVILIAFTGVAFGYHATRQPNAPQRRAIGDLQLRSASVAISGLNSTHLTLSIDAVFYNPNPIGATLVGANYSVSVNGRHLGSGRTAHESYLAPQSSSAVVFPISVGWRSALETTGSYVVNFGAVSWEVDGTAVVSLAGLSLSAPFEFTTTG
jgi:LEA14-like dessication related protein